MSNIYLGANYYPEDWDEELIDFDIEKMKECGFNVVRIAEFSWKKMEPVEGEYDFAWLHRVVDKMHAAGIGVIMGTPTATPPHWFVKKFPEAPMLHEDGVRNSHGGRRHCCSNNPDYIRYSEKIVEKLAEEFREDPGVIGWQIDNEIYHNGIGCCCDHCMKAFHQHLTEKYGDVESLNKAWNLNLFSQAYDDIDDVPVPANAWHNPHIKLEWNLSHFKSHKNFVHLQAAIIRKYSDAPIGTDTMPFNGFDYRELNDPLDVAQFNHYFTDLQKVTLWMDYMRHFSKRPFWNTETQACWNGSTQMGHAMQDEGFVYMNTWLPIMLGGEANLYWLWRTHWAGHELMHGAVLDTSGRYTYANGEIRKASAEFQKVADFLPDYKVKSDTALLFTSLNWNIKLTQDINAAIKNEYGFVEDFYKALLKSGIHPDVIDAKEELSNYKLIFTPTAYTLDEHDFPRRMTEWVREGGVWVVGPMTDIRTRIGTKYKTSPYGSLEEIIGAHLDYILPDNAGKLELTNEEGNIAHGSAIYELFGKGDFEPWLTVTKGHSALIGKCPVFAKQLGKGWVVMLGTLPEEAELARIIKKAAGIADAKVYDVDDGIMVTKRVHDGEALYIVASVGGKTGEFRFEGEYVDLLQGTVHRDGLKLAPYELYILKKA
ncbi:MAG: beta-galactosidase [Clostridia bacterium]|nr:beta-galactosidase [Clostridia bacterium]